MGRKSKDHLWILLNDSILDEFLFASIDQASLALKCSRLLAFASILNSINIEHSVEVVYLVLENHSRIALNAFFA